MRGRERGVRRPLSSLVVTNVGKLLSGAFPSWFTSAARDLQFSRVPLYGARGARRLHKCNVCTLMRVSCGTRAPPPLLHSLWLARTLHQPILGYAKQTALPAPLPARLLLPGPFLCHIFPFCGRLPGCLARESPAYRCPQLLADAVRGGCCGFVLASPSPPPLSLMVFACLCSNGHHRLVCHSFRDLVAAQRNSRCHCLSDNGLCACGSSRPSPGCSRPPSPCRYDRIFGLLCLCVWAGTTAVSLLVLGAQAEVSVATMMTRPREWAQASARPSGHGKTVEQQLMTSQQHRGVQRCVLALLRCPLRQCWRV